LAAEPSLSARPVGSKKNPNGIWSSLQLVTRFVTYDHAWPLSHFPDGFAYRLHYGAPRLHQWIDLGAGKPRQANCGVAFSRCKYPSLYRVVRFTFHRRHMDLWEIQLSCHDRDNLAVDQRQPQQLRDSPRDFGTRDAGLEVDANHNVGGTTILMQSDLLLGTDRALA
jgi:hypothetical protein